MERRNFLKIAATGTALVATGLLGIRSFKSGIKSMIIEDTQGLKLKEEEIDKFLADAEKEMFWSSYDTTKKGFITAHTWLGSAFLPYKFKYSQYRSQIVGTFLLSTDYFTNRMDAGKAIQYVAFYNPYKRPCASPFSNVYYPRSA
jgi:hypothetical protein